MSEKKTKKRTWVWAAVVALIIVAVILIPQLTKSPANSAAPSVLSASVMTGRIENTVVGSGELTFDGTTDVKLPAGIVIDSFLVEAGDYVKAGDPLAIVNAASLAEETENLHDELTALDKEINAASTSLKTEYVKSYVAGRVKQVYAEKGDDTAEIIGQYGALAVLSIDGKMAADVEASGLTVGDDVIVTLSSGDKKDGTVESVSAGGATITLSDKGAPVNDAVVVTDEDGKTIGSGKLYIHQPLEIVAPKGTVDAVHYSEDAYVSAGNTIFTITGVSNSSEYEQLLSDRKEIAGVLNMLVVASGNGNALVSSVDGTISDIPLTATSSTANSSGASNDTSSTLAGFMRAPQDKRAENGAALFETGSDTSIRQLGAVPEPAPTEITDLSMLSYCAPAVAGAPTTGMNGLLEYSVSIAWSPADTAFLPDTVYTANYTLTAKGGYTFAPSSTPVLQGAVVSNVAVTPDGSVLTFTAKYQKTESAGQQIPGDYESGAAGSYGGSSLLAPGGDLSSSGSYSVSGSYSSGSEVSAAESDLFTVAFQIASDETMILSINVDELDILSVEKGQKATVTFDAIDGAFEGSITRISNMAASGSGVAKYGVDILLEKTASMRAGMNATATIGIGSAENVLVIPVAALQEIGGRVFVYTEVGDTIDTLSGERDVTTGYSDGLIVEITDGLSEGDTVYYAANVDDSAGSMFGGMGNFGGGSGSPPERG